MKFLRLPGHPASAQLDLSVLAPEQRRHRTLWWCIRRQVAVVGGWHLAVLVPWLVWSSARQVQREILEHQSRQIQTYREFDELLRQLRQRDNPLRREHRDGA